MRKLRYTVEDEEAEKWHIEEAVEDIIDDTGEVMRVTITDEVTVKSVTGDGGDYDESLKRACKKMSISLTDSEEELDGD